MNTQVKLEPIDEARLDALSQSERRDPQVLLAEAVHEYLDRAQLRDGFKQDALAALREYELDGLHITLDEALKSLENWRGDTEPSYPECHK